MSELEEEFAQQLRLAKIPFLREVKPIPGRKFRWDFQIKDLLVEVQGGIWGKGGHSTGKGITRDMEKLNLGTLAGYHQMHFGAEHIKSGQALKWVQEWMKR